MIMPANPSPSTRPLKRKPASNTEALSPQPLYAADAEKAVLGCMMAQPGEVIDIVTDVLVKDDFFVPAHQEIYAALRDMHKRLAIDVMTIHQWLVDRKLAERLGSPGILGELLVGFASHLNVGSYIRIVKDKSLLRRLQNACISIVQDIAEMPDSVPLLLDRAESEIFKVTSLGLTAGSQLSAAQCVELFREQQAKIEQGEVETRIKTGLQCLDETNGGFPMPSYVVITGEPGVGKSALILNILQNCTESGHGVGGFSAEMTVPQCMQRMVANIARMDSRQMNAPMAQEWRARREKALDHLSRLPFVIDPSSGLTPRDLRTGTRKMVKAGCKLIWLDNAQLMIGSDPASTRVDQLTEVSRTIQHLQKEYGVTFILLAQVTKESQKREGGLRAVDVADCSAFQRDARVRLMMEKDASVSFSPPHATAIVIRIVKYSEGETGDLKATFNKKEQRIT